MKALPLLLLLSGCTSVGVVKTVEVPIFRPVEIEFSACYQPYHDAKTHEERAQRITENWLQNKSCAKYLQSILDANNAAAQTYQMFK